MIIVMASGATEADIRHVVSRVEELGLKAHVSQGEERVIIGVIGSTAGGILSIVAGYLISALMLGSTKYLITMANALSVDEGICFGIIVCLACGIYPAWQGANLNPIDALRHE